MAFIDALTDAEIRDVYRHWLTKRAGGGIPLKASIDPVEFAPAWMRNMFMYRVEGDRFRCILVGTELVHIFGRDETGLFLDEIVPRVHAASRHRLFERAVRDQVPVFYSGPALIPSGEKRRVARLLLPISSDGASTDHIFGIAKFGPVEKRAREDTPLADISEPAKIAVATQGDLDEPGS